MKYRYLRSLIAKIEATLDPNLCMLKLNSGQVVFMSWEQFRDGLHDVVATSRRSDEVFSLTIGEEVAELSYRQPGTIPPNFGVAYNTEPARCG
jgi:hypothetical protein